MTAIGTNAADAFLHREQRKFGNTRVYTDDDGVAWLELHGSLIAKLDENDEVWVSDAGWFTTVTKDRLNALARQWYEGQFDGVWSRRGFNHIVLEGVSLFWDGSWINVSEGLTPELLMDHIDGLTSELFEHPRSRTLVGTIRGYTTTLFRLVRDDPRFMDFDLEAAFRLRLGNDLGPQHGWEIAYEELQNLKMRQNPGGRW